MDSPHNCTVHHCVLGGHSGTVHAGQLRPMGEQWPVKVNVTECATKDPRTFYKTHFRPKIPCVIKKAFVVPRIWHADKRLKSVNWSPVVVEQQNRIVHSHREPFWVDWSFKDFVGMYRQNPYYLINPYVPASLLPATPQLLKCARLTRALDHRRLWFSGGNTSSSLHFDTHDNFIQQLAGTKEVFMWHPNEARNMYIDSDIRYGLSPINVDRVDLIRFPDFARAPAPLYAVLQPGDELFVPYGYWHQLRSPLGRNAMITNEFEIRVSTPANKMDHSPSAAFMRAIKIILSNQAMRCD